ncbi:tetratricopeptide repeat protein [Fontivita pretiosa]|uniref:tetratricopeptide repeat protein n=1 Tax=Fontivita pretiosa TaxID=2989684 RepID=UPI003D187608
MSSRTLRLAGAFTIFIATFTCYWPAMRGQFIWDDDRHVSENPTLRNLRGLWRIWFRWGATPQYYPMTHTSFWIEYRFWGLNPTGYHVTNVTLHSINALLLWRLLRRLEVRGAFLAAAVFALHPVNVESVAWISERKNVLAMCFALLATLAYVRPSPCRSSYAIALVLFICALLSKTITATLPAVLLVLIWWKHGRIHRRDVVALLPFFVAGIGMGLMTAAMERFYVGATGEDWQLSLLDRVLIAGRAIWFYLSKLVFPVRLMFSYPRWQIDPLAWWQWAYAVGVVVVLALVVLNRRRVGRGPTAAVLIFVGTLFPALGFFNTYPMRYSFVADHFQYLSAPAMIALIVAGAARLRLSALIPLLCIVLGTLTWRQAGIYRDAETLWRDTIARNPSSWMARYNLGVLLSNRAGTDEASRHDLEEALKLFDEVERLRPHHDKVRMARGDALVKLGRISEAIEIYGREIERLLARPGPQPDAVPYLERYTALLPNDADAHVALGFVYGELGRFEQARARFQRALEIDPNSQRAREGLELVRRATGRP